jgi:hypothetical protein
METADHSPSGPGEAVLAEPVRIDAVRLSNFGVKCTTEEAAIIAMWRRREHQQPMN